MYFPGKRAKIFLKQHVFFVRFLKVCEWSQSVTFWQKACCCYLYVSSYSFAYSVIWHHPFSARHAVSLTRGTITLFLECFICVDIFFKVSWTYILFLPTIIFVFLYIPWLSKVSWWDCHNYMLVLPSVSFLTSLFHVTVDRTNPIVWN